MFPAEGPKVIEELMGEGWAIRVFYATELWQSKNQPWLQRHTPPNLKTISWEEMERISTLKSPPGLLALAEMPPDPPIAAYAEADFVLALDRLSDPGNLGTIIRTADWFGVRRLILSPDSADIYNPKVIQASMGSIARVWAAYADLPSILPTLSKPIWLADTAGEAPAAAGFHRPCVLVIGSESHGPSAAVQALATGRVTIAKAGGGDSLNAAIAAAILLYERGR